VEFLWFYRDLDAPHVREQLIPDGALELIIDLDPSASPKTLYNGADPRGHSGFRRAWISGMQNRSMVIGVEAGASMMGVHFKTGGARPFFGFPISELTAQVIELDLIWKRDIVAVRDRILGTESIEAKFDLVESFLFRRAQSRLLPSQGVMVALEAFRTRPAVSMRELAAQLGMSQKRMIAEFDREVGFTPKMTSRVARFQKVLRRAHGQGACDWAAVALEYGYYDQAHLIHEFQEFAGMTPETYCSRRTSLPNYIVME
jgi:AraC-like DNA-binding protein